MLYGPPGTGKSSLSLSIAGRFDLDIYILSLSAIINKHTLKSLFAKLPSRCVILLEDIDAVSSKRSTDAETEDSRQTSSPSQGGKSACGRVSLSALLNVIDGVASQEGQVLIMTTNHITYLDEALIRPGRVNRKVKLGLTNKKMTEDLFCIVFKPVEGDVALPKNFQSDVLVRLGEDSKAPEPARSQEEEVQRVEGEEIERVEGEEVERVERLAEEFAARVPELVFSPAEILSFLLEYRQSPGEAIDNMEI